jgi:tetratricopeptide (TPR) repeat protein
VLEGSVRRSGDRIRINTQLIDAETDAHLWAERFDRDTGDLFALQDEITSRIAIALSNELIGAEATRPTERPDAHDYILRGRAVLRSATPDTYGEAISLFERALAVDPRSVEAQSQLANALVTRVLDNMTNSAAADIARAERLVGQASAASPRSYLVHFVRGLLLRARGRCEEAIPEYQMAIELNRNAPRVYSALGRCKILTGSVDEAIPDFEQAIRRSPRDPWIDHWYLGIAQAHLLLSRIDKAIFWLEKARSANPSHCGSHAWLASAFALMGEAERAAAELAEARRLSGDDRFASIARLKSVPALTGPKIRTLLETTYYAGLRKAGIPEE